MNVPYSTVQDQIIKLKAKNLTIPDEDFAADALSLYGYSNLIKSYQDPYVYTDEQGNKMLRNGIAFHQIYSLYLLDKNLRNSVMAAMLALEECFKEAAADVVGQRFGTDPADYLKFRNFQNRKKSKQQFSLSSILKTMNKELSSGKDPVHHYMIKYGSVPPWILFKNVYFSTIVNYIDQFKQPERDLFIDHLYDRNKLPSSITNVSSLLRHTLFMCLSYRNMAAHGGRIYNYDYQSGFNNSTSVYQNLHGYSQFLTLLSLLKYSIPFSQLQNTLNHELTRHCNNYPEDATYLGVTLNMNIIQQKNVFVSGKSKIYHVDSHCSGIKNPTTMELSDAIRNGYSPCKRCVTQ